MVGSRSRDYRGTEPACARSVPSWLPGCPCWTETGPPRPGLHHCLASVAPWLQDAFRVISSVVVPRYPHSPRLPSKNPREGKSFSPCHNTTRLSSCSPLTCHHLPSQKEGRRACRCFHGWHAYTEGEQSASGSIIPTPTHAACLCFSRLTWPC